MAAVAAREPLGQEVATRVARGADRPQSTWLGGGAVGNPGMWSLEHDECLQTDSCGSCGQVFLWCKCDVVTSRTQRTARAGASQAAALTTTAAAGATSPTEDGTPISSVWSSEEEKGSSSPREFGAGLPDVVNWHRSTSFSGTASQVVRDRAPSVEGRELSEMN